jgi:hypothetical protein
MAKVNIKVKAPLDAVKKAFQDTEKTKVMHESILDFVINRIRDFARIGTAMDSGKRRKLPELSPSYKEFRKGRSFYFVKDGTLRRVPKRSNKLNDVDPAFFRPNSGRSNLTFTGKLLNSLKGSVDNNRLTVEFDKTKRSDSQHSNSEIYEFLLEKNPDYRILDLDNTGISRIKNIVLTELRKQLGLVFKLK